jgi:signal transduction histidine kinase
MHRILVVFGLLLCSFSAIQAQNKITVSKIDSLAKRFEAAKDAAAKINVLLNAPKRIGEYSKNPTLIINLYYKALKLAENIGDKKSAVEILIEIAFFEMYINLDEPKAFTLLSQGLVYAEAEQDYASCAKICHELAAISEHQNLIEEMYEYFLKSIAYTQKVPILFLRPYRWASAMYLEENKIDDALKISRQAVSYVDERTAPDEFKALAYGYYYAVLKRVPSKKQEADVYKRKVVNLLRKIKTLSGSNRIDDIAKVCYEVEQYQLAIFFASQLFEKTDLVSQHTAAKINCYEVISASYERLGEYQKSLENYKKYTTTYVNDLKNTLTLESGRKVIREEGERNLILKQKEIDEERFYRNISFAIAAFIVVLGAIIFIFYRREQARKAQLQHLNATKDKLFAILSHDLRSPVGNLENNVMLTNWGALSREEFIQSTQSLGQEIGQVRTMLDNVLHWAISQMGGMKPTLTTTLILPTVETQTKLLLPNAQAKGVKIDNAVEAQAQFSVDANHLAIIVRNLLQNAIKFTQAGGEIRLKSFEKGEISYLEIKDSGVGISQDRLGKLFEINKESSQQGTGQEQGTGLGLVLVKELVDANQGTIEVTSEIDKGTTFLIGFK